MKIVTAAEMRSIDRKTTGKYKIPGMVLMERAGLVLASRIRELSDRKKVVVLAGGGNNGGDGLAAARNLHAWGWHVRVLLMVQEDRLSPDCLAQCRMAVRSGVPVCFRKMISRKDLHGSLVLDALLGTGLNKAVAGPMAGIIDFVNRSGVVVVSADIPSGVSADSGLILGYAVKADYTVTFGLPKIGHVLYPGAEYTGRLFVEDIGFPAELISAPDIMTETVERPDAASLIPERPADSHKGDYGHVLVLAGSRGKTGAALLAARACLRSGAGMVTIGMPETLLDVMQTKVMEEMVLPLPDTGRGTFSERAYDDIVRFLNSKADVLAAGPGITTEPGVVSLIRNLIQSVTAPIVLDADGINCMEGHRDCLRRARAPVVLTPHPGEMQRLLRGSGSRRGKVSGTETIKAEYRKGKMPRADMIAAARSFARATGTCLVLKGSPTVVAESGGRVYINTTGNAGMATAGSGDVLTGIIASLIGQGLNPLESAVFGVYLHGLAGDSAVSLKGMHSLIASDITNCLPDAFLSLSNHA